MLKNQPKGCDAYGCDVITQIVNPSFVLSKLKFLNFREGYYTQHTIIILFQIRMKLFKSRQILME